MKLPRDLSGDELVRVLCRNWGYRISSTNREATSCMETEQPSHQRLAVPAHTSSVLER